MQMVHQVQTSMDIYIGMVEKIADYINKSLCNSTVFQARTTEELEQADDAQATYDMLEKIASSYPEIVGILIATDNDLYVSDGMTRLSRDPFYKEKWYQQAQQNPEDVVIVSNAIGRNIIAPGIKARENAIPFGFHKAGAHAQLPGDGLGHLHVKPHQGIALVVIGPRSPGALGGHDDLPALLYAGKLIPFLGAGRQSQTHYERHAPKKTQKLFHYACSLPLN